MDKPRLGYVGLGAMGLPFAKHLAQAGYEVTVKNRSDRPYAEARASGLIVADTLEKCAAASDILFTCLPSIEIIEQTYAQIEKPGLICVDNSTVPHDMALRLHANLKSRGMAYVECPIFGSAQNAIDAEVYLIASGDQGHVETILPIALRAARGAANVGRPGAASLIKVLQNGLGHVQMAAIAQTLVTAERAGIDPATFVEVVSEAGGMASTALFKRKAPQMLELPEQTGAKLMIAEKDAKEAAQLTQLHGNPDALITHACKLYRQAVDMGLGERDFAAIITAARKG